MKYYLIPYKNKAECKASSPLTILQTLTLRGQSIVDDVVKVKCYLLGSEKRNIKEQYGVP